MDPLPLGWDIYKRLDPRPWMGYLQENGSPTFLDGIFTRDWIPDLGWDIYKRMDPRPSRTLRCAPLHINFFITIQKIIQHICFKDIGK